MVWTTTTDITQYAARAEPWLLRNAVRNNVLLPVIEHAGRGSTAWPASTKRCVTYARPANNTARLGA